MKIQFEIKEKLPEIIAEVRHSDKWQTTVVEKTHGLERVTDVYKRQILYYIHVNRQIGSDFW